jgi:hypothetical protein
MKYLFLVAISLFWLIATSCQRKATPNLSNNNETLCKNYFEFISNNFKRDSLGNYNYEHLFPLKKSEQTPRYRNEIINNCLIGKKKEEILATFGEPNYDSKNRIDYYFNSNCSKKGTNPKSPSILHCVRLIIYFSNEGTVCGVPAIVTESGQKQ